jgi:hypothetical protein
MAVIKNLSENDIKIFWDKVEIKGDNDCWIWKGFINKSNIGIFNIHKQQFQAHRISYELKYGNTNNKDHIIHICENSSCINPVHMYSKNQNIPIELNIFFKKIFWEKVNIVGKEDCWNWLFSTDGSGYGHFSFFDKMYKAHQVSYKLTNGEIPIGMCVLHKCDNPLCCNPEHLWLGTQQENIEDMVQKNRNNKPKGSLNGRAKLNEILVSEIRYKYKTEDILQKELAIEYNVAVVTIARIIENRAWII